MRRLLNRRRQSPLSETKAIREETVFERFKDLRKKKGEEWRAKGYSDKIIAKGFTWAQEYTISMSNKVTENPELRRAIQLELYPKALEMAEIWMSQVTKYIQGPKKRGEV